MKFLIRIRDRDFMSVRPMRERSVPVTTVDIELEKRENIDEEQVIRRLTPMFSGAIDRVRQFAKEYAEQSAQPFRQEDVRFLGDFIVRFLDTILLQVTKRHPNPAAIPTVLSASRPDKFSMHYIHSGYVFDRHETSVAFIVWELISKWESYLIDQTLKKFFSGEVVMDKRQVILLCRTLKLEQSEVVLRGRSIFDMAPYSSHQCFRVIGNVSAGTGRKVTNSSVGNGKMGKSPLSPSFEMHPLGAPWQFKEICPTLQTFEISLIMDPDANMLEQVPVVTKVPYYLTHFCSLYG